MTAPIDDCLAWVAERESVRQRKESGALPPWTDDPIIRAYRFCNVRREDDRVTRWIDGEIRVPFAGHPLLWFMLCAARQINWPGTLSLLIGDRAAEWYQRIYPRAWPDPADEFAPSSMAEALEDIASTGAKVFTGAYIVTAPSTKGTKKTTHVALKTLGALWADRERIGALWRAPNEPDPDPGDHDAGWRPRHPRMEEVHARLMRYDGWGPFLAYQAVVDMSFTDLLRGASDVTTRAAAGPGTIRGLNRLALRRLDFPLPQAQALREMRALWPRLVGETGVEMDFSDVPNVMCETDKYLRVKNGEGKPRAMYVPGRGS